MPQEGTFSGFVDFRPGMPGITTAIWMKLVADGPRRGERCVLGVSQSINDRFPVKLVLVYLACSNSVRGSPPCVRVRCAFAVFGCTVSVSGRSREFRVRSKPVYMSL